MSITANAEQKMITAQTAGQRLKLWKAHFPNETVNHLIDELSKEFSLELKRPYLSKNPFFPRILDFLFTTKPEQAELFIRCFYPQEVYALYKQQYSEQ
ncbi:hypothetical protein [Bacillus testis]|uniref:hypothetical protein n=1 Tax=Bacillus testis TaxID=1622072 RepID=UPI00067EFCAD|nr:hypothetical protein [Bacillus testis]